MGIFQKIQDRFNRRFLLEILEKQPATSKKRLNLESSKTIGILFDATEQEQQNLVLEYADALRLSGKKVQLLGAVDTNQEDSSLPFPSFSRKQLDWALRPKGKAVEHFIQTPFDLLIHLNPRPKTVLDFIAAQTRAELKVGPYLSDLPIYDLMIDNTQGSITGFIREMEQLLKKTNRKYEYA